MKKPHLVDGYSFHGFTPSRSFEKSHEFYKNRVVKLKRNQKKQNVFLAVNHTKVIMIKKLNWFATFLVEVFLYIFNLIIEESNASQLVK